MCFHGCQGYQTLVEQQTQEMEAMEADLDQQELAEFEKLSQVTETLTLFRLEHDQNIDDTS